MAGSLEKNAATKGTSRREPAYRVSRQMGTPHLVRATAAGHNVVSLFVPLSHGHHTPADIGGADHFPGYHA
jgi:hypothetical protein